MNKNKNQNKYTFQALFKGIATPKVQVFHAPSSNKAHKMRSALAKNPDLIFVTPIQQSTSNKMASIMSIEMMPEMHPYFGLKHNEKKMSNLQS